MSDSRSTLRTLPFWLMFLASMFGVVSSSAAAPNLPLYVDEVLGEDLSLSGALIAISEISAVIAMPFCGLIADRFGYRHIAAGGAGIAAGGFLLLALLPTVAAAVISRVIIGLGIAVAVTLTLTVLVTITPPAIRGRVLSIYGLSVWIGVAIGPQVTTLVHQMYDSRAVFVACLGCELVVALCFLLLPRTLPSGAPTDSPATGQTRGLRSVWHAFQAVWVAGIGALTAWCAEGLMLGFLLIHLVRAGVPSQGVFGAASIFTVFAASVIAARIVLANMPDRLGPLRSTTISLVSLAAGLAVFAIAQNFLIAALGAVLVGVGFSPLYPSLTMLATRELHPDNRAMGLGLFGGFTSIGFAIGGLLGGIIMSMASSTWAFVIVAALQVVALIVIIMASDSSPRPPMHTDSVQTATPR